jgi:tetratricopeptide (TPR) repeat protein
VAHLDIRSCLDPLTTRAIDAGETRVLLLDARHLVETTTADDTALSDAAVLLHESLPVTQHSAEPWWLFAEIAYKLGYVGGDEYELGALELSLLQRALTLSPTDVEARALRAEVLMLAGRYKEGAAALEGIDPNHWRAASALARLTEVTRNPLTYRTALRSMVAHGPATRRPTLLNSAGTRLAEIGRFDEALAMLDECIQLSPRFAWAYHSEARILAMLGLPHGGHRVRGAGALAWPLRRGRAAPGLAARAARAPTTRTGPRGSLRHMQRARLRRPLPGRRPRDHPTHAERGAHVPQKPCATCGYESLGFAKRCPACHQPI